MLTNLVFKNHPVPVGKPTHPKRGFYGSLVVRAFLPVQGLWVPSLVGKLRYHMPCSHNIKT